MAGYLIDTTPLAAYLLGRARAGTLIAPLIANREASTSIIVYGEVYEYLKGYIKSPSDFANYHNQLRSLLHWGIPVYNLNLSVLERYADIRRSLRGPGKPGLIGDADTLIAATALEHDLTVVSSDSDFQRVQTVHGLKLTKY